jgi:type III pantothenate kinase
VDRWLAMLAAWNLLRGPVCVIDCGTALTVDALDANGQHLGGLIVPGLGMMRDSLLEGTDGIAYDSSAGEESSDSLLAHSTRSGVEVGSLYALLAFIDRVMTDLQQELGDEMQCILTGGDAAELAPLLAREVLQQPQLVLDGLALLVTEAE